MAKRKAAKYGKAQSGLLRIVTFKAGRDREN